MSTNAEFFNQEDATPPVHPIALFRLTVLGPLASRGHLPRGELKRIVADLASRTYNIPSTRRCYLSEKTIESWYYTWKKAGVDGLIPQQHNDKGCCKLPAALQDLILTAKRENLKRSLDEIIRLLETEGTVAKGEISRSTVHRLLKHHDLSRPPGSDSQPIERRSFEARHASDVWYGDAMHGPKIEINGRLRKTYLISWMDDASRLIAHSAFCPGETALDVEGVLKQALLRRGLPKKLVIDNGAAYRAVSFQGICARLGIQLVYCRPYEPEAKGKLERWHRVVRQQFLSELHSGHLKDLDTLNTALWAWVEKVYHTREHSALGCTPLARWQRDLALMRSLGPFAHQLDALFYHRHTRKVRKDGTVSFNSQFFEVAYLLVGRKIQLVVDPQANRIISVESLEGEPLGEATPLDVLSNNQRHRQRTVTIEHEPQLPAAKVFNAIEQVNK